MADVMMPKMDGFELTKEIRARFGRKIPVLLVTAVQNPLTAAHERDARPIAAIEKPFSSTSLVSMVQMLEAQGKACQKKESTETVKPQTAEPQSKGWLGWLLEKIDGG